MWAGPRIGLGLRFVTEVIFGPSDSPAAERAAARRILQDSLAHP